MENQIFQLKFTSKQFSKMASKELKHHDAELNKVRKAIQKDDAEIARIHGQNAIRIKNQANGYLRLASRMDAVASRLESAIKMKQVTKQMGSVTKAMDKVLGTMNVAQIEKTMSAFESAFEEVDMRSQMVEGALNSSTAGGAHEDEVDALLEQVSDAHGLEFASRAANASTAPVHQQEQVQEEAAEEALEKRLAALRG